MCFSEVWFCFLVGVFTVFLVFVLCFVWVFFISSFSVVLAVRGVFVWRFWRFIRRRYGFLEGVGERFGGGVI